MHVYVSTSVCVCVCTALVVKVKYDCIRTGLFKRSCNIAVSLI